MSKEYRVKCRKLDTKGRGVVSFNNVSFSVPYLMEGETALISLLHKPGEKVAKLVSVEEKAADRINPKCPYFYQCGGCDLQHISYKKQLQIKKTWIEDLFKDKHPVEDVIGMDSPYHYRNKIHQTLSKDRRGNIISGIYEEESHRVIDAKQCLIQESCAAPIMESIKKIMKAQRIEPYDEDRRRGVLRHVLIKYGYHTGQIMVVLVSGSEIFPGKKNFVSALLKAHPEITTIVLNINTRKTSMVLGDKQSVVYGTGRIDDVLCGYTFSISPKSFYQVNPLQTARLYEAAIASANLTGKETVLDAYSGIGTISLIVSKNAKSVTGVEINKDAVADAKENAKKNGVKNVSFICEDASLYMVKQAQKGIRPDVAFIDPPRSGCDERFLTSIVKLKPSRLIYISCNPETQKRDVDFLLEKGYKITKIQPVDMFPFTKHVENIVSLSYN